MNIKSLLLGSAAALVAVSGARAADAVVIADPEPVEYVRVCDVYGTGYFYIPGTETCLRIGGYVRYQASGGDLYERNPTDHLDGSTNGAWSQYSRLSLRTWTGTETELGTLKTYTETRFNFANGGGTSTSLNFAWIDLAGFRVGKGESGYMTFIGYAGSVLADDIIPSGPYDTNFVSYTFTGSNGFSAMVGLEEGATSFGHNYTIDSYLPHIVAGAKFTQGWGGVTVVGGYDSIHETWGVKARLDVKATDTISAFLMGGYGDNDDFNYYKPWGGEWAVWGGLSAKFSEKAAFNIQLSYDDAEEFAATANIAYDVVPGFTVTPEVSYFDDGNDDAFGGIIRFQRSF